MHEDIDYDKFVKDIEKIDIYQVMKKLKGEEYDEESVKLTQETLQTLHMLEENNQERANKEQ